ncbi:glutaredoxin family protein [Halopenitus sp. H-Gu1]|uniref:glutaredoxin family protein n=1 Tax=Halopenitus sp. H-Gu1 TaxID=3242697 RepID=UPI00359E6C83
MTFSPESDHDAETIADHVESAIDENDVVLFMKGNRLMPQCGYSKRAVQLISTHVSEFETIDVLPALPQYREALSDRSDWETIPQAFVDGEFVGGSDILAELEERGDLESTLSVE